MSKVLVIRVETESGSIYQLENQVEQGVTHVQRLPAPGALRFFAEPMKVIRYSPIRIGQPLVVSVEDYGESRTTFSTPVKSVKVTLS
jgi:hypothetical protein